MVSPNYAGPVLFGLLGSNRTQCGIMALLSVAIYDATVAAWDSKYAYNRLRPTVFDPSLMAALPNPQSPSYPSEHATVGGAASTAIFLGPLNHELRDSAAQSQSRIDIAAKVNTRPEPRLASFFP